jgi:hypothetical protein
MLAVLRRPATRSDKLLDHGPSRPGNLPGNIYVRYVRRARVAFGAAYYVIPTFGAGTFTARCAALVQAQLRLELPHVPSALRTAVRELGLEIAERTLHDSVSLFALGPNRSEWGLDDVTATAIEQGYAMGTDTLIPGPAIYGLVPDGVASVKLYIPAKRLSGGGSETVVVSADAVNNVFVVEQRHGYAICGKVNKVIWRAADGNAIKAFSNPRGPISGWGSGPAPKVGCR